MEIVVTGWDTSWIAAAVGGCLQGQGGLVTGSVETDSRRCGPGSLYIARVGESSDGHGFVAAAMERGAVCAIVERPLPLDLPQIVVEDSTVALGLLARAHLADLRSRRSPGQERAFPYVIGITGSAGKTTTKDLLGQALRAAGEVVFPELSFNNEVGCPLTILRASENTRFLVLEMGASGPGHIRYLTDIAPLDMAIVLMVGSAHLGGFGSIEVLAASKRELVEGVRPGGVCLLNYDDPRVRQMAEVAPASVFFSASGASQAAARAAGVVLDGEGQPHFRLEYAGNEAQIDAPLVGEHQVSNLLAAATAALVASSLSVGEVAEALGSARRLSPHRLDVRSDLRCGTADGVTVIDDSYNANVDSMAAGLRAARTLAGDGRLVAVLGEMLELGEESAPLHSQVGRDVVQQGVDVLVAVGQGTDPLVAVAEAAQVETYRCDDYREVLRVLPMIVRSGDTMLLKGSLGSEVWRVADSLFEAGQDL